MVLSYEVCMGKQGLLPEEYDEQVVSRKDQEKAKEIVVGIVEKIKNHSKHLEPSYHFILQLQIQYQESAFGP